jgi:primary-amine oxidase
VPLRHALSPRRVVLFVVALWMAAPAFALEPAVYHPLDALIPQEYWTVYTVLRDAGDLQEKTAFVSVLLKEPPKSVVLAWKPGDAMPRRADVILVTEGKAFAAVVDITAKKVDTYAEIKGDQPTLSAADREGVGDKIKKDPRVIEAMKKRGITDMRMVDCYVMPTGFAGRPEQVDGARIAVGSCGYGEGGGRDWDREVGGIFFVYDLTKKKIVRFSDYGAVPMPVPTSFYDADGGDALPGTKPIIVMQPEGPSFSIDKGEISWQNWHFRFRLDPRIGAIVNLVSIEDGGKRRSIMYEGSLSELFVPYQDPEETWNTHTFIDAGEYFVGGGTLKPLEKGVDCPDYAKFFSSTFYETKNGQAVIHPKMGCLFERTNGDPAWRHADRTGISGRPSRELVLRTVATVGNYDYILDWRFEQDGTMKVAVGATGILEVKPVTDQSATGQLSAGMSAKGENGKEVEFGQLVSPGIDAVDHDHFFSYRLDLDVDGTQNSFMTDKLVPYKLPKENPSPRRVIWAMQPEMVAKEGDAMQDVDIKHPAMWRFVNESTKDAVGYPTGLEIMAGETAATLLPPDEWPSKRAAFANHQLWVTPYDPNEVYASGTYLQNSKGDDGLGAWVKQNRSIMNTDIVAWYTIGLHHVPRPEDWPQMPVMWHELEIRPFHFFNKNPGMDLPMTP